MASLAVYGLLLLSAVAEQFGKVTSDTKSQLVVTPSRFLGQAFSLWDPTETLGQLQNQAYGYLFPMGPFFLVGHLAHLPPWLTERFWSTLLLVLGCEGARRLAAAIGLSAWPAWVAGMAYGLSPRVISEVGVRSAEILPGVVLPWVLLPIVLVVTGRLGPRRGAVLSVAAFLFSGAVNGTATVAPLPLVVLVILWAVRRGRLRWSFVAAWSGLMVLANLWWVLSLLKLNSYSPPFFDYVEDATTTTSTSDFLEALRGASNWVSFLNVGSAPNWPAGWVVSFSPAYVVASGVLATVGLLGLARWRSPWRTPLAASALLGLICLTIGHASALESPLAPSVRDLLDGPFALLRNVAKADPLLRLPLAIGTGCVVVALLGHVPRWRIRWWPAAAAVAVGALAVGMAQPALAANLRTPGWTRVPSYWSQAAHFVATGAHGSASWVVPGTGFGIQTWGWTDDEPMSIVGRSPWVTRSQVPLAPPQTIRILSQLENYLATGSGSPQLGGILARLGIGDIVVRHDLAPDSGDATSASLVSIALARSGGLTRVRTFGRLDLGPAIEVYRVDRPVPPAGLTVRSADAAVTVASDSADVVNAIGAGLIPVGRAAVVRGDSGWVRPVQVLGDAYRDRERQFGRVQEAEGPMLARGEPRHGRRVVANYPSNPGARPTLVQYAGLRYVTASSSQAWTNNLGAVLPEDAPYSAVDGDLSTGWVSGYYHRALGQWVEVRYRAPHTFHRVTVATPQGDPVYDDVTQVTVTVGRTSRLAHVDPSTGIAYVDLDGATGDRLRVTVTGVEHPAQRGPVRITEIAGPGLPARRTLVLPSPPMAPDVDYLFTAAPETRACLPTLLGPDCDPERMRASEESAGIDRTFRVPSRGRWTVGGTVVARSSPATVGLLDPIGGRVVMRASSTYADDPTVSARMAYDGTPNTSWIADARDPAPTLTVDFAKPRRIDRITVSAPAAPAIAPTTAVLRSGGEVRRVSLDDLGTFAPLRVKHLTIRFANPTRRGAPLGVGDVSLLPGRVAVPLHGDALTGAVCGFGPEVRIDGARHRTAVRGLIGDVVSSGPLSIVPCGEPLRLSRGVHHLRVVSTSQFQPVRVSLTRHQRTSTVGVNRTLRVEHRSASGRVVRVGPGGAALLSLTQNFNRGWVATLDGRPLTPQRMDGWAQGWRLPAGAGGTVRIHYAPEASYRIELVGGLALAGVVLLLALVLLGSTRLTAGMPVEQDAVRRPVGRRRYVLGGLLIVVGVPLGWLLLGVPGAAAALVAWTLRRWPGVVTGLAALAVVAGTVLAGAQLLEVPQLPGAVSAGLCGLGACVLLVAALLPARRAQ